MVRRTRKDFERNFEDRLGVIPRPADTPAFVYRLPRLHAMLNGTCSVLLIISYVAIRRKHVSLHKKLNVYAEVASNARHWASSDTTSSGVRIITDRSHDACSSRALSSLPPVFAASV